jgi:TonB family protein
MSPRLLRRTWLIAVLVIAPLGSMSGETKKPSSSERVADAIRMDLVVHHVPTEYPFEARRSKIRGSGIVVAEVAFKTGIVTVVRMEKSTGSRILDQAALDAFRQWKFKPGTVRRFRVPVKFGTW